jgi:hypothetical protein
MTIVEDADGEIHGVTAESTHEHGNGGLIAVGTSGQEFIEKLGHANLRFPAPLERSRAAPARFGPATGYELAAEFIAETLEDPNDVEAKTEHLKRCLRRWPQRLRSQGTLRSSPARSAGARTPQPGTERWGPA